LPSLGNAPALSDYEKDLRRIETELAELEPKASADPIDTAAATLSVSRLYARSSLNGNLKNLRAVEASIDKTIERIGPAEDLCLLKANLDFKLHRLAETKRDLAMAPALAGRRQGRTLLADIAFQEGRYSEARASLEALAAEDPSWDVLSRIAHIEGKMGTVEQADQLYLQAEDELTAKEMRSFAWIELQRGLLDLSRGRVDAAIEHYDFADRAYSGYWLTTEHIADALASTDHYERVLAQVDKPEVAQKLGKLEQALSAYLESAEHGEVHYYHHLAEFFSDVRPNGDEAIKWARKDIALRDNFNTQTALAWALQCAGQSSAAVPFIEQAINSGIKDAAIYQKAAFIFESAGKRAKAHLFEHRAARLNPLGIHPHTH
jgi:tetratricopeptide (TPR) repeat protein